MAKTQIPIGEVPAKTKLAPGSSLAAQAKQLILALNVEIPKGLAKINAFLPEDDAPYKIDEIITEHTANWLADVARQFATSQRGLPLATQLANIGTEITAHWQDMPVVNGKVTPDRMWQDEATKLLNKRSSIERAIRIASEKETEATAPVDASIETNSPPA